MKSILTSEHKIINEKHLHSCDYKNNSIKIIFNQDINSAEYHSFGIHIVPNILFRSYNSLNEFSFILEFNFKLEAPINFRIYNGIEWILIKTNSLTGTVKEVMNFNFKKYWRIQPSKIVNCEINNVKIYFDENSERFKHF